MPQIAYKPGENRQNNQKYLKMKFSILLSADLDLKGKNDLECIWKNNYCHSRETEHTYRQNFPNKMMEENAEWPRRFKNDDF